jgi:hypothetical protein
MIDYEDKKNMRKGESYVLQRTKTGVKPGSKTNGQTLCLPKLDSDIGSVSIVKDTFNDNRAFTIFI